MKKIVALLLFGYLFFPTLLFAAVDPPALVPKTGQTTSYATGDDGDLQAGVAWPNPRFSDIGDGTVGDNLTGLIWAKDANAPGPTLCNPATTKTWYGALDYIACLNSNNYLGFSDWVLPNINELKGLVDTQNVSPALPSGHPFTSIQSQYYYWTSSTYLAIYERTRVVNIAYGYEGNLFNKLDYCYVWPVRKGQWSSSILSLPKSGQTYSYASEDDGALQRGVAWPEPRFTDNSDGTVTDNLTGLIWLKNANCFNTIAWGDALASANTLAGGVCGLTDGSVAGAWRLPNRKELASLIDNARYNPALPAVHPFNSVQLNYYWSSSSSAYGTDGVWVVDLYNGDVKNNNKANAYYAWPVRGGVVSLPLSYSLSVTKIGSGSITPSSGSLSWSGNAGTASHPAGTEVTLTAFATTGSTFAGWSGACSGTGTCTVIMDVAKNVTATFSLLNTADTVPPTVTAFILPATSNSLAVEISDFTASDTVGVTGYCLAETNSSSGCIWTSTAPSSYTFTTAGSKTLYAFAKDEAGNVSTSMQASTVIMIDNPVSGIVTQLTSDSADDIQPAWSPDGSTIAFVSNRIGGVDGSDLFAIQPDGQNERVLAQFNVTDTWHGRFGQPSWNGQSGDLLVMDYKNYHEVMRFRLSEAVASNSLPLGRSVYDGDSSYLTRLLYVPGGQGGGTPVTSPDGSKLAWRHTNGSTYMLRMYGGNPTASIGNTDTAGTLLLQVTEGGWIEDPISFSPDGTKLVFAGCISSCQGKGSDLHVIDVASLVVNRITTNGDQGSSSNYPTWSSNNTIAFSWRQNDTANYDLHTIKPDGTELKRLTQNAWDSISPSWSPDGNFISFASNEKGNYDIYNMQFGTAGDTPPALVPKTGQTTSYAAGDDGDLNIGVAWPAPRFTDIGDGTVADNLTGLIWAKDASTPSVGTCAGGTKTWQGALDYVACLNNTAYLGQSDWFLPNINELKSLIDVQSVYPVLPVGSPFTGIQSNYYWSSSTDAGNTGDAWYVHMNGGRVERAYKPNYFFAWPVRGGLWSSSTLSLPKTGQTNSFASGDDGARQRGVVDPELRFTANGDGTVTDNRTGLIWLQNANCLFSTWADALNSVNTIASGSCDLSDGSVAGDWRLPNRYELNSLIDYGRQVPAFPVDSPFAFIQTDYYWSSSTNASNAEEAWYVNVYSGSVHSISKTWGTYAWPVRGGQSTLPLSHPLDVTLSGSGSVTPDAGTLTWSGNTGTASYPAGAEVTLTAFAYAGSIFAGWSGACSGTGTCTVIMDKIKNVTATFSLLNTVDTVPPTVTAFTLPTTNNSLTVAISSFTTTDNIAVTGYCLAATNSRSGCTWSVTAPSSYTFTTAGNKTLYAFARDVAGNISSSVSASTMITLPTVRYGDIDDDGETKSADALLALQMAIGKRPLDLLKADVAPLISGVPTPDGKVTAADALVILRKAVGLW